MTATFATITSRMRLNFFSRDISPEPDRTSERRDAQPAPEARPQTGKTFPADEVVWGITIRNGYDEIDDPAYHRGTTQHAYLEGNDNVAICGFRPPQSGPRTRRRSRLGLPSTGENPMCGMCARMVVAPRPRAPIPVSSGRPAVAVPVRPDRPPVPVPVASPATPGGVVPRASVAPVAAAMPANATVPTGTPAVSPWVRQRSGFEEAIPITAELGGSHAGGLLDRGVRTELDEG